MKTGTTIALVAAGFLAVATVAWAADQNQSPSNDPSPGYSQSPVNGYDNGATPNDRGQRYQYYGGCCGSRVYQERVSNQVAPDYSSHSGWRGGSRWFGWIHPRHDAQRRAAYQGCW